MSAIGEAVARMQVGSAASAEALRDDGMSNIAMADLDLVQAGDSSFDYQSNAIDVTGGTLCGKPREAVPEQAGE